MDVERRRKVEPAAKSRNCLRERGEKRALLEVGPAGLLDVLVEGSVIVRKAGCEAKAITSKSTSWNGRSEAPHSFVYAGFLGRKVPEMDISPGISLRSKDIPKK